MGVPTQTVNPATGAVENVESHYDMVVFASAARTATVTSDDFDNPGHLGVMVTAVSTDATATPSVTVKIQGKDAAGEYYDILSAAAITDGSTTRRLTVYPTVTASANVKANDVLPRTWRVVATHGDADSITYSVAATLLR